MATTTSYQIGPGFFGLLGLAFIILKLCNVITWSWWWVLLPIWGQIALGLLIIIILIVFVLIKK